MLSWRICFVFTRGERGGIWISHWGEGESEFHTISFNGRDCTRRLIILWPSLCVLCLSQWGPTATATRGLARHWRIFGWRLECGFAHLYWARDRTAPILIHDIICLQLPPTNSHTPALLSPCENFHKSTWLQRCVDLRRIILAQFYHSKNLQNSVFACNNIQIG